MVNGQHFTWGAFISAVITFVLTAAVVYFVVVLPVKAIMERRRRGEEAGPAEPTQVELLVEIRDLLRAQQGSGPGTTRPGRARRSLPGPAPSRCPSAGGGPRGSGGRRRRITGPLPPADVAVVGRPQRAAGGTPRRVGGRGSGHRLPEPLEHLGDRQRGQQRPRDGELAAPGARSR